MSPDVHMFCSLHVCLSISVILAFCSLSANVESTSSTVLKYCFEALVLYLSLSILSYFIFLLHYISEGSIVLLTSLHLFKSYFLKLRFYTQNI